MAARNVMVHKLVVLGGGGVGKTAFVIQASALSNSQRFQPRTTHTRTNAD